MAEDAPRAIGDFRPQRRAHSNGSRTHRRRPMSGVIFGVLVGALVASGFVDRIQWLNLSRVGWWGRPAAAALAAGAMVGWYRRDGLRPALLGGSVAAVLSLWGVYALLRASTRVLFVDRSIAAVIAADLARLLAYAAPAGAAGAALAWGARAGARRLRAARG